MQNGVVNESCFCGGDEYRVVRRDKYFAVFNVYESRDAPLVLFGDREQEASESLAVFLPALRAVMLGYAVALLGYCKLRTLEEYKVLARFVYLLLHRCDVVGAEQGVLRAERGRVSRHECSYSLFRAVVGNEAQADYVFVPNIGRALVAREVDSVGAHIGELSALHGIKRLFYRVCGLFEQILHELGVAPGDNIVIPSVLDSLDIVLEHLRQIAPETLCINRAVAVDR